MDFLRFGAKVASTPEMRMKDFCFTLVTGDCFLGEVNFLGWTIFGLKLLELLAI